MIARRTVLCLGIAQLISWGTTYYLIGGLGQDIAAELGWSTEIIYGGFSVALVVMGVASRATGRLIDRYGGRHVMVSGSLLNAAGAACLAVCHDLTIYFAAWLFLGLAMRLTLYDAAFAALVRIGGVEARRPLSQITLFGGLSSTIFWPLSDVLSDHLGWRATLWVYTGFALLTIPLHAAIPKSSGAGISVDPTSSQNSSVVAGRRGFTAAEVLYACTTSLVTFLSAGMSAHMITLTSAWISSLRGIGQSSARLCEILFGGRIHPLMLNLIACAALTLSFIIALSSRHYVAAAIVFAFLYGAANGVLTITRGTVPLVFVDARAYGGSVGQLVAPSFFFSAAAPAIYATVIERIGEISALLLSLGAAGLTLAAAVGLFILNMKSRQPTLMAKRP
jgi:MFS family permease